MKYLYFAFLLLLSNLSFAQKTGTIRGQVVDKTNGKPIEAVSVSLTGTAFGSFTDEKGNFSITDIPVGTYNVSAFFFGYFTLTKYNISVTTGNDQIIKFELEPEVKQMEEIVLKKDKSTSASPADIVTPLSTQSLTKEEIRSNPGGNFDISRAVQALPGVAGSVGGFRNDIIIRGGAPNENVYYLDGIEIPVINHFSTQGSAGGPQGMLNVSFLDEVKLSSSALYAGYNNALSSTFEFSQREGNPERLSGNIRLSASELATTLEGPLSDKTNFLVSARRSYLQLLFSVLDLPIRPNYWDFQVKTTTKIDDKTTLKLIGVGAIDEFTFTAPRESDPDKEYALRSSPLVNQWNYTNGLVLNRSLENGSFNVYLSRNMFNNEVDRFEDKQFGDESKRSLKLRSQEIENKLRVEVKKTLKGIKLSYGASGQYVKFDNNIFNRLRKEIRDTNNNVVQPEVLLNYDSDLKFFKYGAFGQASTSFIDNRLGISFGLRTDLNSFTNSGNNPLNTLSPRISTYFDLSNQWKVSASWGMYYKIPPYTILGFKDDNGNLVNKDSKYIRTIHYVTGLEYLPKPDLRFTLEGFYKRYSDYPVSVRDGISLANRGTDFGALGNEEVNFSGDGYTYGFEFYGQKKLTKKTFAIFSYTYVRSLFAGDNGEYIPSAWDYRHLISVIGGQKFGKGWELGVKYRFAGGAPYTPFDLEESRLNYESTGNGVPDYSKLNSERLNAFNQVDVRLDKKLYFEKWTLDLFIDIQNVFMFDTPGYPQYTFSRNADNSGFITTDGQALKADGSNAEPVILSNNDPIFLPTFGFILEF